MCPTLGGDNEQKPEQSLQAPSVFLLEDLRQVRLLLLSFDFFSFKIDNYLVFLIGPLGESNAIVYVRTLKVVM